MDKVVIPDDKPEAKAKAPAKKPKPAAEKDKNEYLINWKEAAKAIEAELKKAGWNSVKQGRNPRFIFGLVSKHIIRPLVMAINSQKGV